jgi:hypothetical protein
MTYPEEALNLQPRLSVEEDFGVDIDLSPQLNLALREEVLSVSASLSLSLCLSVFLFPHSLFLFQLEGSSFHHSGDHQVSGVISDTLPFRNSLLHLGPEPHIH